MPEGTTGGYPHDANADETRQAQQGVLNDVPVDLNHNAITARSQALTVDIAGKGFVAAQERRQIIADQMMAAAANTTSKP